MSKDINSLNILNILAGPEFDFNKPSERLNYDDALYTEAIHTNVGCYGFEKPICHADFYPNGKSTISKALEEI